MSTSEERAEWAKLADVERLTAERDEALASLDRLHSWTGLMELLDEHWPESIFPTLPDSTKRDTGPRIVSLIRWLDQSRAERDDLAARIEKAQEVHPDMYGECHMCSDENGPLPWPCPTIRALDGEVEG